MVQYILNGIKKFSEYIKKKNYFFYSGFWIYELKYFRCQSFKGNFELWISGSGNDKFLKVINKDKRIKFFGLLLANNFKILVKADIFKSKTSSMLVNDISFPSKLFDYLSWNKPIISTCTKSLDPVYRKIHSCDNPVSIAIAMGRF